MRKINSNLKENSVQERLKNFNLIFNQCQNRETVVETHKIRIFADIKFLSIISNENRNDFFYFDLFNQQNFLAILTSLFDYFLNILYQSDQDDYDSLESIHSPFRDLLEIVVKLVQCSMKFCEEFLKFGFLKMILQFFENSNLVKTLFECYIHIMKKVISIFYYLCKSLYFIKDSNQFFTQDSEKMFSNLKQVLNFFEETTECQNT